MKTIKIFLLLICLGWSLISCGKLRSDLIGKDRIESSPTIPVVNPVAFNNRAGKLSEVAPPTTVLDLARKSDRTPQVKFNAPQNDRILNDSNVKVELEIENLLLYRDKQLGLGPHLNLILDDRPAQQIYDLEEPIILENLAPGTHTLRAFAVLPWNESYKNDEAYAQTTFHILTKTNNNNPRSDLPLLTYNSPEGTYGAEPILLDFYLTNAPLHLIARENPDDDIKDWRIRVTINGESFILEEWQPIYLTGFERGNNWVQIELLDEEGNNLENAFNNTVRLVTYEPKAQDALARLVTGQISTTEASSIIEPKSKIKTQPVETPVIIKPDEDKDREIKIIEEQPIIVPKATQPKEAERFEESEPTTIETSKQAEPIKIEPKASNVEIIKIENNSETETTAEIKVSPTETVEISETEKVENSSQPEINNKTTSIKIIETEENLETEKPIAEIELPKTETVKIIEADSTEDLLPTETPSNSKLKTPEWLKNLWSNLRQKISSITQQLSNRSKTL
ncbi:hypothetical protein [Myxosarcina sp. GI1]|uniref:hypothetical protein n=1 Tax=Myxosarcina sp. GI1 TaxID=1541065 RepID=UPI000566A7B9|nr:hypothetical protein [Myxosarcina sp. GI1]